MIITSSACETAMTSPRSVWWCVVRSSCLQY